MEYKEIYIFGLLIFNKGILRIVVEEILLEKLIERFRSFLRSGIGFDYVFV